MALHLSRTRARQRDRDRVMDALSLAYSDGQLHVGDQGPQVLEPQVS